jgi:RNA methyltransferase, TrmH family
MPPRIVLSQQNARLKELRKALASPGRNSQRRAGIEGAHLLAEALRSGVRVSRVFVACGFENLLKSLPLPGGTEVLLVPRPLLDSALATETPQPLAALVEPPEWTWAHLFKPAPTLQSTSEEDGASQPPSSSESGRARGTHFSGSRAQKGKIGQKALAPVPHADGLILVLAGLQDPGNLGTIMRSAEAFGAGGVVSLPGTVSAWNPKAVRASAGSVFRLPLIPASPAECIARLREAELRIWTTDVRAAQLADAIDLTAPTALIFGNEGAGVPPELAAMADGALAIPCPGPVESLNAAVAASVLLYEAARQRRQLPALRGGA